MAYQALYRSWRPARFCDMVGQEPIVTTLKHQIQSGRVAHAYLFCGSRGTGKTTAAKIFARAINCQHPEDGESCGACDACVNLSRENNMDVIEIDAASNNGVDEIRDLRDKIKYPPTVGKYKVYIVDEVHMLSTGAFNALLKTLEEPPAHAVFILATTEPQKLPATVLSRCQRYDFRRIPLDAIAGRLKVILDGVGAQAEPGALEAIARAAEGGMRDAISLMDMCLSYGGGRLDAASVRQALGASDPEFVFEFSRALLESDAARALSLIGRLDREGGDAAAFAREVTAHMRALLLAGIAPGEICELLECTSEDARLLTEQAALAPREKLERLMELFMNAQADMKWADRPRAVLELCAVRACHPERERSAAALEERVALLEKALASGALPARAAPGAAAPGEKAPRRPSREAGKPPAGAKEAAAASDPPSQALQGWEKAKQLAQTSNKMLYSVLDKVEFGGMEGDVVTLRVPRKWVMYFQMLERKKDNLEELLSGAFGRAVRARVTMEGAKERASTEKSADAGKALSQVFDVFGRENVSVVDAQDDDSQAPF